MMCQWKIKINKKKKKKKEKKKLIRGILLTQRKANLKSAVTGRHGLQIMNCH